MAVKSLKSAKWADHELKNNFSWINFKEKLRFAQEITGSILFLHKQNTIHQDLHTKNILVDDRGRMLISDFGHSIHVNDSNSIEEICGMPAFTDPHGKEPFENKIANEMISLIYQRKIEAPIENTPNTYIDLYERCWDQNPINRPEAKTIMNELDIIEKQLLMIWIKYLIYGGTVFCEIITLRYYNILLLTSYDTKRILTVIRRGNIKGMYKENVMLVICYEMEIRVEKDEYDFHSLSKIDRDAFEYYRKTADMGNTGHCYQGRFGQIIKAYFWAISNKSSEY
ncbi:kinase-like domain-containing protein [Gigaspora rosea]|uniref:Kinase-like domain-containing protein n=1 Tax=Gigaspora rosea TaxID=44941 RepID=A0A397VTL4_9GLOM|nr:kinase-like domain-containing protein [Gigaspora rosea]